MVDAVLEATAEDETIADACMDRLHVLVLSGVVGSTNASAQHTATTSISSRTAHNSVVGGLELPRLVVVIIFSGSRYDTCDTSCVVRVTIVRIRTKARPPQTVWARWRPRRRTALPLLPAAAAGRHPVPCLQLRRHQQIRRRSEAQARIRIRMQMRFLPLMRPMKPGLEWRRPGP